MKIKRFVVFALIALLAVAATSAFVYRVVAKTNEPAEQGGGDDGEGVPISGSTLDRASAAALEYVGGGRVTGSEAGDEEGYYEIEVTLDDGRQVDVHLDENFSVLTQSSDAGADQ